MYLPSELIDVRVDGLHGVLFRVAPLPNSPSQRLFWVCSIVPAQIMFLNRGFSVVLNIAIVVE